MEDTERNSIETFFNQKNTDELFAIWNKHNLEEWREEAFDVMEQLLIVRTGNIPSRVEKISIEHSKNEDTDLNAENQPVFYNPDEVEKIGVWFSKASIAVIVISLFVSLTYINSTYSMIHSWFYPVQSAGVHLIEIVIVAIILIANVVFNFIIYYLPLKGFGQVLKILKEMEFNSRKSA